MKTPAWPIGYFDLGIAPYRLSPSPQIPVEGIILVPQQAWIESSNRFQHLPSVNAQIHRIRRPLNTIKTIASIPHS